MRENRWYMKSSQRKRIPKTLEKFRKLIPALEGFNVVNLMHNIQNAYPELSLTECSNLMCYLHGVYDAKTNLLTTERFKLGLKVSEKLYGIH